jgi:hypothetical protein
LNVGHLHSLRRSGSSSQPFSCDFPDQTRDDLAFGLLGRFQDLELLGRQMTLDRFLHERAQLVRLDSVKLDGDSPKFFDRVSLGLVGRVGKAHAVICSGGDGDTFESDVGVRCQFT